jgi:hypothetical protein
MPAVQKKVSGKSKMAFWKQALHKSGKGSDSIYMLPITVAYSLKYGVRL